MSGAGEGVACIGEGAGDLLLNAVTTVHLPVDLSEI